MNENEISSEGYATQRQWENIKAENTWEIFKYISEFVEGFEKLTKIGPCVSIFGSARTKPNSE